MCQTTADVITQPNPQAAHVAGTCPCCGENELAYGDSQLHDSQYTYKWKCAECEATGQEVFDLVFNEHLIKKPAQVVYDLQTEHPTWTWSRWAYAIGNDGTLLSYTEWVAANIAAGPGGLG